ncbi:MAG: hypothetical protein HXY40_12215 [Chloroflexi bacterium]|nr:hypothetical protein [Chloroflexota bacterium]
MRLRLAAGLALFFLLLGLRPDSLPFIPGVPFSDALLSHWPNAYFLRESLVAQGAFPFWREMNMAGQPFAANPLNKIAYPLQWLVLLLPPTLHLNVLIVLHSGFAAWGMWRWTQAMGMGEAGAALSTLAYALSPRISAHLGAGHLDILYALAWWPWLLWSIHRLFHKPQRRLQNSLQTGLFAALVTLADVRVALFALITAAVYSFAILWQQRQENHAQMALYGTKSARTAQNLLETPPLRRLSVLAAPFGASIVCVALTAALVVPLLSWFPYLSRATLTPADAAIFSLNWESLIGLLLPAHGPNHELLTYVGLPVLLLAFAALFYETPRRRLLWLSALLAVLLYALGPGGLLWTLSVQLVPGLSWFRVPARAWLILAVLLPVLAGWGLEHWLVRLHLPSPTPIQQQRVRLAIFSVTLFLFLIGLSAVLFVPTLSAGGIGLALGALSLGITLFLIISRRITKRVLTNVLLLLTFFDLTWTGIHWAQWRGQEAWLAPHQALAERLVSLQAQRIYSPAYSLEQQVAAVYDLRLFGGLDPFQLSGIVDAVEQGSGVRSSEYSVLLPALQNLGDDSTLSQANREIVPNTEILGLWGVSHIVAPYPIEHPNLQQVDVINGVYVYANRDTVRPLSGEIPDWPASWPGLPDQGTVQRLNQWTWASFVFSAAAFLMVGALLLGLRLRANG